MPDSSERGDFTETERSAMLALAVSSLGFGVLFALTTLLSGDVRLALFTVPVMLAGVTILWARSALDGPRREASLVAVAWSIQVVAVAGAFLVPDWQPTMATIPILSVLVAGRVLGLDLGWRVLAPTVLALMVVFIVPPLLPPPEYAAPVAARILGQATFVVAVGMTLLLMVYERRRLVATWHAADLLSNTVDRTLTHLDEGVIAEGRSGQLVVCNAAALRQLGEPTSLAEAVGALHGAELDLGTSWEHRDGLWIEAADRRVPVAAALQVFSDGPLRSVLVVRTIEAELAVRQMEVERAAAEANLSGAALIDALVEAMDEPLSALSSGYSGVADGLREILAHHQIVGHARAGELLGDVQDVELGALVASVLPEGASLRCPAPVTLVTDAAVLELLLAALTGESRAVEIGPGPLGVRVTVAGAAPDAGTVIRAETQLEMLGGTLAADGGRLWIDLPEHAPGDHAGHRPVVPDTLSVMRRALDQLQQCVVLLDAQGAVVYGNPWWLTRVAGWGVGTRIDELAARSGGEQLLAGWEQVRGGQVWRGRLPSWGASGGGLLTVLAPVRDVDGDVGHVLLLQHDPLTLTALEERLEEVDRLAADIAHELNSPLAALSGFLELAPTSEGTGDARTAFRQIATIVGRLRQLGGRDVHLPTPPTAVEPVAGPARILAIDDEALILRMMRRALKSYDVETATGGDEALPRLLTEDWDLILCDLMMPGMTGMELHRRVAEERPELAGRFVFVSGGVTIPEVADWLATTDARVLAKPFQLAQLNGAVAEALGPRLRQTPSAS